MCTNKQADYVRKLAKWKGQVIDQKKIDEMTVEEVSELIDKLKKLQSVKEITETEPKAEKIENFNPYRFGMCCKIVAAGKPIEEVLTHRTAYINQVKGLYEVITKAEEELNSSAPKLSNKKTKLLKCDFCDRMVTKLTRVGDPKHTQYYLCDDCIIRNAKDLSNDNGYKVTNNDVRKAFLGGD